MTEEQATSAGIDGTTVAPEIDPNRPSIARVYDYVIGGKQHFAIDRQVSKALFAAVPEIADLGRSGRSVLLRVTNWLVAEAGIDQIIDIGSGLPTEGNVHEIALAANPDARVVYVDNDPIVLAHGRALLASSPGVRVIVGDVTRPEEIYADEELRELIDLDRPFAVITSSILHHLDDAQVGPAAAGLRAKLSPGSYFVSCNFLDDDEPRAKQLERAFLEGGLGTGRFRTWAELGEFFDGLELVEPGLVYGNEWKPDANTPIDSPVETLYSAGIGRKPTT